LNSLEFLACIISIWLDSFHQVLEPESCLLSLTDSTTALGWICRSNFSDKPDKVVQLSTARKLADIILSLNVCLYSQWFSGEENIITDSLSRDFHECDSHLASLLLSNFPDQVPFGLKILPIPPNIVSWLTCLMLSQPQKEQWSKEPIQSKFVLGLGPNNILPPLDCNQNPSLTSFLPNNEQRSSVPSLTPSEKVEFAMQNIINPSSLIQFDLAWTAYHRSLSWLTNQIQGWTEMESAVQ